MSSPILPEVPASMKSIQHYLKIAAEHDVRDPVVSYWARMYAAQSVLSTSRKKTQEENNFVVHLLNWLEKKKKELHDNEAISNDTVAQAHLENWALKLFLYADKNDRESNFSKNVIQSFYTAGLLYDILTMFGDLSEEASQNRKYAKWKAAYIHNCLKNGETPIPGPINQQEDNISQPAPEVDLDGDDEKVINVASNDPDVDSEQNPEPENNESGTDIANSNDQLESDPENASDTNSPYEPVDDEIPTESQDDIAKPTPPTNTNAFGFPSSSSDYNNSNVNPTPSAIPSYPNLPMSDSQSCNSPATTPTASSIPPNTEPQAGAVSLNPDQLIKAQKYIKWAGSAINYDDIPTAVGNLQKALHLLTTGQDSFI